MPITGNLVDGIAKDAAPPRIETIDEKVADGCGHGMLQWMVAKAINSAMGITLGTQAALS